MAKNIEVWEKNSDAVVEKHALGEYVRRTEEQFKPCSGKPKIRVLNVTKVTRVDHDGVIQDISTRTVCRFKGSKAAFNKWLGGNMLMKNDIVERF
jgi:hypothetical protein